MRDRRCRGRDERRSERDQRGSNPALARRAEITYARLVLGRDGIETDESCWPIVVHTTIGIPSEQDVIAFMERADEILARGQRHAVIFDNSKGGKIPSYLRERSVAYVKRNKEALERLCIAKALVIRSAALRFLMTTLMLVTSHGVREEVFGTLDEAMEFCRRELEREGIRVPEPRRANAG